MWSEPTVFMGVYLHLLSRAAIFVSGTLFELKEEAISLLSLNYIYFGV